MSDLHDLLGPDLVAAIEAAVDRKVAAALAGRENGCQPDWFTIQEAAEYLRVSERTVERMVSGKRIRTTTLGRRRLVSRADLKGYMDAAAREG